jgi:hypothetical protein
MPLLSTVTLCAHCAFAAAQPTNASAQRISPTAQPTGPSPQRSPAELHLPAGSNPIIANIAFTPPSHAAPARQPFQGTLRLTETRMTTLPTVFSPPSVLGRDPTLFPGVSLSFFTDNGDLVPFTQDVIRYGSSKQGRSYWDIIVQPGRVWFDRSPAHWSRAAFPFALVNSLEGETHNGLATFLYKDGQVSKLRFQIVQQTAPFYIKQNFVAAGLVPAAYAPANTAALDALRRGYEAERAEAVPIAAWSQLAAKVGGAKLAPFDGSMPPRDVVLSGLDYRGTFYLKECRSAGGPLPWCDRARFGVWSATKALANETALLRLAEKFGLGVAMDRFLKSKQGPGANLWSMLQQEVFAPIGIHYAPTNRTLEADGGDGHPLMAYGYYPTLSDMVLIARLYQNGGKHGDRQILYAPRIRELLAGPTPHGLPTGEQLPAGETSYTNAFWITSYRASPRCRIFYPRMIGWGGNIVALLPNGLTSIRLAKSGGTPDNSEVDTAGMAQVANSLSNFCP